MTLAWRTNELFGDTCFVTDDDVTLGLQLVAEEVTGAPRHFQQLQSKVDMLLGKRSTLLNSAE